MTEERVVSLHQQALDPEERKAHQVAAEAERLSRLAPGEWKLWLGRSAEQLGVSPDDLAALVQSKIQEMDRQQRLELRETEQQQRQQRHLDRQHAKDQKEKNKTFRLLLDLSPQEQERRLASLADHLGESIEVLREEFATFVDISTPPPPAPAPKPHDIEPWHEPVDGQLLLNDVRAKARCYVVMSDEAATAFTLWTVLAWAHAEVANHSPILAATSVEPDSGKTTLLSVLGYLVPRPLTAVELTAAGTYHIVDAMHPTLIVDEADNLFRRKGDLLSVFNSSWARGTRVPRLVQGVVQYFDLFCPKAIGMIGRNVPSNLGSRCIFLMMWPKMPDEVVQEFAYADDDKLVELRRKLVRWVGDNVADLKARTPVFPPRFDNRLRANWKLLLAIAELVGGEWPEAARRAAVELSRRTHERSVGVRLLTALRPMFAGKTCLPSKEIVERLTSDPDGEWQGMTQHKLARLLKPYGIEPHVVHPTGRPTPSPRGYLVSQFATVFARLLPSERHGPHTRTSRPIKPP
jgi:putative DNA primase/helicase